MCVCACVRACVCACVHACCAHEMAHAQIHTWGNQVRTHLAEAFEGANPEHTQSQYMMPTQHEYVTISLIHSIEYLEGTNPKHALATPAQPM